MPKNLSAKRRRSLAVKGLGVLDTPVEAAFNRFVNEAEASFGGRHLRSQPETLQLKAASCRYF
jgi:hypothetical protein